jgi:uncharacterized protein (DUF4415 family)
MSKKRIVQYNIDDLPEETATDWERLDAMTDEDIDYSDIPETDDEFWDNAEVHYPRNYRIFLPMEADVLQWYRKKGKRNYKTLMRKALKSYMETAGE